MTNHSGGGTPRTDAIAIISNSSQHYLSIVSLARQLERELNAALSLREREGWQWVPTSMTGEMRMNGRIAWNAALKNGRDPPSEFYDAALTAAPPASPAGRKP